jgi:cold shock CspA family protein
MKRTMVMVGLVGLGLGPFAVGMARADTGNQGATAPGQAATTAPPGAMNDNPVAIEQEEVMRAPFTVESIDRANRKVVVQSPNGARSTVNVSPDAQGFDTLKRGDQVELDYYKSSVLSLAPSRPSATPSPSSTAPAPANAGMRGNRGHEVTTSARVTYVDNDQETIQVTTADGRPQTLFVRDPALQRQMRTLKPGERVQVTYTEPTAVGLRQAPAK